MIKYESNILSLIYFKWIHRISHCLPYSTPQHTTTTHHNTTHYRYIIFYSFVDKSSSSIAFNSCHRGGGACSRARINKPPVITSLHVYHPHVSLIAMCFRRLFDMRISAAKLWACHKLFWFYRFFTRSPKLNFQYDIMVECCRKKLKYSVFWAKFWIYRVVMCLSKSNLDQ